MSAATSLGEGEPTTLVTGVKVLLRNPSTRARLVLIAGRCRSGAQWGEYQFVVMPLTPV